MKRGAFVFLTIFILLGSSINVNADLVDWFSQDHVSGNDAGNLITGYWSFGGFFNSIGSFFKKLFGQEARGVNVGAGEPADFNKDGCVNNADRTEYDLQKFDSDNDGVFDNGIDLDGNGVYDFNDDAYFERIFDAGCVPGEETTTTLLQETTTTTLGESTTTTSLEMVTTTTSVPAAKTAEISPESVTYDLTTVKRADFDKDNKITQEDFFSFSSVYDTSAADINGDGSNKGNGDPTDTAIITKMYQQGATLVYTPEMVKKADFDNDGKITLDSDFFLFASASGTAAADLNGDGALGNEADAVLLAKMVEDGVCAPGYVKKDGSCVAATQQPSIPQMDPNKQGKGSFTTAQLKKMNTIDVGGSNDVIDNEDFFAFAAAFGKKSGDADWGANSKFDFDGKGSVEVVDFTMLEGAFGQKPSVNGNDVKANQKPVAAVVPASATMKVGETKIFDGASTTNPSKDPEGKPLTYVWGVLSTPQVTSLAGVETHAISGENTQKFSFTPKFDGEYIIGLKVNDGQGASNSESEVVMIKVNVQKVVPVAVQQPGTTKTLAKPVVAASTATTSGVCGNAKEGESINVACPQGQVIDKIVNADFVDAASAYSCSSQGVVSCSRDCQITSTCVGQPNCRINSVDVSSCGGDPCPGKEKKLILNVVCKTAPPVAAAPAAPKAVQPAVKPVAGVVHTTAYGFVNTEIALDGSNSVGAGVEAGSYEWRKKSGPGDLAFTTGTQAKTNVKSSKEGVYIAEIVVKNGAETSTASVNVNVFPPLPERGAGEYTTAELKRFDIDGKGVVDFEDFFVFADAFGKKSGEEGYNAKADFTTNFIQGQQGFLVPDGKVDFEDFFAFGEAFQRNVNSGIDVDLTKKLELGESDFKGRVITDVKGVPLNVLLSWLDVRMKVANPSGAGAPGGGAVVYTGNTITGFGVWDSIKNFFAGLFGQETRAVRIRSDVDVEVYYFIKISSTTDANVAREEMIGEYTACKNGACEFTDTKIKPGNTYAYTIKTCAMVENGVGKDCTGYFANANVEVKLPAVANKPPVIADSVKDIVVTEALGYVIILQGAATDADGDALTYKWEGGKVVTDADGVFSPDPEMEKSGGAKFRPEKAVTGKEFTLTVTDGKGGSATKTIKVTFTVKAAGQVQCKGTPDITAATLCSGDDVLTGLTQDVDFSYVEAGKCTSAKKCEYECKSTHELKTVNNVGSCVIKTQQPQDDCPVSNRVSILDATLGLNAFSSGYTSPDDACKKTGFAEGCLKVKNVGTELYDATTTSCTSSKPGSSGLALVACCKGSKTTPPPACPVDANKNPGCFLDNACRTINYISADKTQLCCGVIATCDEARASQANALGLCGAVCKKVDNKLQWVISGADTPPSYDISCLNPVVVKAKGKAAGDAGNYKNGVEACKANVNAKQCNKLMVWGVSLATNKLMEKWDNVAATDLHPCQFEGIALVKDYSYVACCQEEAAAFAPEGVVSSTPGVVYEGDNAVISLKLTKGDEAGLSIVLHASSGTTYRDLNMVKDASGDYKLGVEKLSKGEFTYYITIIRGGIGVKEFGTAGAPLKLNVLADAASGYDVNMDVNNDGCVSIADKESYKGKAADARGDLNLDGKKDGEDEKFFEKYLAKNKILIASDKVCKCLDKCLDKGNGNCVDVGGITSDKENLCTDAKVLNENVVRECNDITYDTKVKINGVDKQYCCLAGKWASDAACKVKPVASLLSPAGGNTFDVTTQIVFSAEAEVAFGKIEYIGIAVDGSTDNGKNQLCNARKCVVTLEKTLTAGSHNILAVATMPSGTGEQGLSEPVVVYVKNLAQAPRASITMPDNNIVVKQGDKVRIEGLAEDPDVDGKIVEGKWYLDSNEMKTEDMKDAKRGCGAGVKQCFEAFTYENLAVGEHEIKFSVKDNNNPALTAENKVKIFVRAVNAPVVSITSPLDIERDYREDEILNFNAEISDDKEVNPANIIWKSDISGEIGRGKTFTRQLPLGYHTLSVEVTDADNAKSRAISKVHVKSNKAPTALILRPKTGTSYGKGDPVDFIGSATDPDGQIAEWWWTSSIDGEIGTMPEFVLRNLSLGKHDVTLLVVDNDANKYTDTFSVWITIDPKSAPLVSLTNPSDGSLLLSDAAVSIKGTIVDPDSDGKIVNYQIISKQQGVLVDETFTQATAVKQVNVDKVLEKGILKRGVHELTLQATDDQGHNVQQMIKVKIADAQSSSETALNGRIGQVIGFDSLTSQDVELQFVKTALRLGMKLKQGLDKRISISTNFYAGNSPPLVLGSVTKPAGDKRALKYLEISPTDTGLIDGSSLESGGKISLRIEYTDAELSARGLNENELELYTFDESKKQWVKIAGQVDAANNFVQASIEHFSIYALFGKEIVYGPGATPTTTGTTLASGGQTVQPGGGGGGGSGGIGGFVAVQKPGTNDCRRVAQRELNFFKQNGYVQVTSCAGGFTPPSGVTTTTLPGRGTLPPLPGRGTLPTLPGVGADDDNDGLLDSWERQFFNGLQENAEEDYDGDGFTNEEEYKLNSDPTDSNDPESKGIGLMWIGLGGGLVIVIILGLVYLRKRRRKLGEAPEKIKKEEDKFLSGIGMEGVQKDAEKIVEKNTEKKEQGKEEVEINPKIVDYVVKARKAGYDDETIKNNLLQVGWDRKMVEAALG